MKVHGPFSFTFIQTEYFPFATGYPLILTGLFTWKVVAQFAPGVHVSSQCTAFVPNNGSRPRARGREYSIVITVPSMVCDIDPISLARICAPSGNGSASVSRMARFRVMRTL